MTSPSQLLVAARLSSRRIADETEALTVLDIETIHHVSLVVTNLDGARAFYSGVLGLEETDRPEFPFDGAWYRLGDRSLHLIVPGPGDEPTFRQDKAIDSHDAHFAIRVRSYRQAVEHLQSKGYRQGHGANPKPDADNPLPMRLSPTGKAGFPQIYILDPDRNVIEINAAQAD
jgi:glyoxylase I family protein